MTKFGDKISTRLNFCKNIMYDKYGTFYDHELILLTQI